jgi:hypothetical protein
MWVGIRTWRSGDLHSGFATVSRVLLFPVEYMATSSIPRDERGQAAEGPKFHINIEGKNFDWNEPRITVMQLRQLGGLPSDTPVEMIDLETNEQRTLSESETIELRPGLGFAKKIKFQRG